MTKQKYPPRNYK